MGQDGKSLQSLMTDVTKHINAPDDKDLRHLIQNPKDADDFKAEQERKYTEQYFRRKYSQMFRKDSLFSDPDLKNATFNNFKIENSEQEQNVKAAKHYAYEYCKGSKFNTLLVGEAGRGKTHLAIGMLKAINEYMSKHSKYFSCLFMDVNEMVTRMMDYEFHGGNDKYSRYHMEKLCNEADLLVLDDLGTESSMKSQDSEANNMTQKFLFSILNARNNTIITSNLSSKQMDIVYNGKLNSRIKRNIGNHIIKFTNETRDMRQGKVAW